MTPRLDPVEDPSPEQAELLEPYRTFSGGEPFNIFRTLARHPKLMKRAMVLATGLLVKGNLPPRIREIVILRVAWRTGSDYEWGQHVRIGLDSGLARDEIDALATEEADRVLRRRRPAGGDGHRRADGRRRPVRRHLGGRGGDLGRARTWSR